MSALGELSSRRTAGGLFLAGFALVLVGAVMWTVRNSEGSVERSLSYRRVERGLIVSAVVMNTVGFVALAGILRQTGETRIGSLGAAMLVVASALLVVAEIRGFDRAGAHYPFFVAYVVLALTAQALIGGALIRTTLIPRAIGWSAVAWSLAFLIFLPIVTPGDMYFPVLHHIVPLAIGIALIAPAGAS